MTFRVLNRESFTSLSPVKTHIWTEIHRVLCLNSYLHDLAQIFYSFCSNSNFLLSVPLYILSLSKKKLKHFQQRICVNMSICVCLYIYNMINKETYEDGRRIKYANHLS